MIETTDSLREAVLQEALSGLDVPSGEQKTLAPWLFYDERGSQLFERITQLPEYYLTRTERDLFATHADEIIARAAAGSVSDPAPILTIVELGAGTAAKTGILLRATLRRQPTVVYQPVDVSESALAEATENIRAHIPGVTVRCQIANYVREGLPLDRLPNTRTLALYIGSSIGNFTPADARAVLRNLRAQLLPGDALLLGNDLRPGPHKTIDTLLSAYNDASGTTAAFNRNLLHRLNRELETNFDPARFSHEAIWNPIDSRIEMHLRSTRAQTVRIPASSNGSTHTLRFAEGETIHTENSYKFNHASIAALLGDSGFTPDHTFTDPHDLFAVTLAKAI